MVSKAMGQIILIGAICFGTIGMFNAMSSIGNAGKHSPTAQNLAVTSSSIAYIIGFLVAGGTYNMLGPRPCVAFGGLTFVLYAGAMRLAKDNDHSIYPPLAGILLGLGAGLIWVTQGAMMMSYPTEDNKGKYIAIFWAIFNLGAVLGSILPLVLNNGPGMDQDDVTPETYYVYMIVMGCATLLAFFLSRPSNVVRDNGEPVTVAKFAGVKSEFLAILSVFCDWRMLLLIPAFFFSNFSYTYQFNDFNGFNFNIRTRSLNSILFWVAQIIGALVVGHMLDRIPLRRPHRAMLGLLIIGVLFMATWVGALMMQLKYKWERRIPASSNLIDYEHGDNYTGPLTIYAMFGFCDAAFAVFCYWLMGALSNKHDELSRYAGFFKSIQSLGSAVAAPLDLAQTPLLAYLVTNWILCAFSIVAMFLVCRTITDTTVDMARSASNNDSQGESERNESECADDESYYYDDDDECSYEYDDEYEQDGTDESGSYCSRSTTGSSHNEQEKHRTSRPPTIHSGSFEGDSSTICGGISSDGSKTACGSKVTHSSPRNLTRSSTRTTDSSDAQIHDHQKSGATRMANSAPLTAITAMEEIETQSSQKRRSSSVVSSSSVADPTRYPSPTFQHPHEQVRRNFARMSNVPPMTEIQDSGSANAEMRAHLSRSVLMQHPAPTFAGDTPFQYFYTQRGGLVSATSVPITALTTPGMEPSMVAAGQEGDVHAHVGSNGSNTSGPSMAGPTPTLMISQESSLPVPLYTFQPYVEEHDSSLGPGYVPPTSFASDSSGMGLYVPNSNLLQPFAPDHLYPQMYQPPYQLSQGAGSSTGSTRYDEDQDMDSVETCSISSMSSGRDSIASMSEMAPNPDLRPPRQ